MIRIDGSIYERVDYCKVLPSGSLQICQDNPTHLITETGEIFPIDTLIEHISADYVTDVSAIEEQYTQDIAELVEIIYNGDLEVIG